MPEYELFYWPFSGRAEAIRLAFTIGGIPFKDNTPVNCPDFLEKKDASGCQVPFLTMDGQVMGQSMSILRYVGKLAQFDGKPLYPADPTEAFWCDELIGLTDDVFAGALKVHFSQMGDLGDSPKTVVAALFEEGSSQMQLLEKLDKRLENFGPDITIADLHVFVWLNSFCNPSWLFTAGVPEGALDNCVPDGALDKFDNLNRHHDFVAKFAPVLEYYKDNGLPTFRPLKGGAFRPMS